MGDSPFKEPHNSFDGCPVSGSWFMHIMIDLVAAIEISSLLRVTYCSALTTLRYSCEVGKGSRENFDSFDFESTSDFIGLASCIFFRRINSQIYFFWVKYKFDLSLYASIPRK